jgi:hypothetical protein
MSKTCLVAVRVTAFIAEVDPGDRLDPIEILTAKLREEMIHGRDHDRIPILISGVTAEMIAFFQEHPDHN